MGHARSEASPPIAASRIAIRDIADGAEGERRAELLVAAGAGGLGLVRARADGCDHLRQRGEARAHHEAVRHVILRDVDAGHRQRIAANQQADAEHGERGNIADEGDAEGRHRDFEPAARHADGEPGSEEQRLAPALVASLDGLRRRHPGRPGAGGGKHPGVEHPVEEIRVEQHGERGAGEHRRNEVAAPEQERDADGKQETVGGAEGRRRDVALGEVLDVNGAVAGKQRERHPRQNHRHQRADDGGVRRHPELKDELDADDGAEDREHDQEREGGGREGRGMRLVVLALFGICRDVGHFS